MQVYKEHLPDLWTKEMLEWTMFDLMDQYIKGEAFKVHQAYIANVSGAFAHFPGVAVPAVECVATVLPPAVANPVAARGNMHGYYHAIFRCAIANGATIRTCCPVEEIIIEHGRAVGVRLRDDATLGNQKIYANKAVISAAHIKPTFLKLIGPKHLDAGFLQRIKDLSLKGGSLYMTHFLTKEELRYRPQFKWSKKTPIRSLADSTAWRIWRSTGRTWNVCSADRRTSIFLRKRPCGVWLQLKLTILPATVYP